MNFISFEFFIFLIVFFLIYFISPQKIKKIILLIFSCFYIGFYKKEFLIFILGISLIFYLTGIFIDKYSYYNRTIIVFKILYTYYCKIWYSEPNVEFIVFKNLLTTWNLFLYFARNFLYSWYLQRKISTRKKLF